MSQTCIQNGLDMLNKASPFLQLLLDEVLKQIRCCYMKGLLNGWLLFPVLSLCRILMGQLGVCSRRKCTYTKLPAQYSIR